MEDFKTSKHSNKYPVMAQNGKAIINILPDELLLQIFRLVVPDESKTFPKNLQRMRQVCSRWNAIITPLLYRSINISPRVLTALAVDLSSRNVKNMFEYTKHLKIDIYHQNESLDYNMVASVISGCKNLESIRVHYNKTDYGSVRVEEPSTFPTALHTAIQSRPNIRLTLINFDISDSSSEIPVSNLVQFSGAVKTNMGTPSYPVTVNGILSTFKVHDLNVNIGRKGDWLHARTPKISPPVNWDWSRAVTLKFSLDALYHLDDIFLLIKDVSFSSLRKLTYECPRGVDNTITARRLRGLFAASKINHLVLNIHRLDPLASVLPEIGSIGGSLQHLEVNRMTVQEALELQLSCPHLISLVIAIFDFDAENIYQAFKGFSVLQRLYLYEDAVKQDAYYLETINSARGKLLDRIQKFAACRPETLRLLHVRGFHANKALEERSLRRRELLGINWTVDENNETSIVEVDVTWQYGRGIHYLWPSLW